MRQGGCLSAAAHSRGSGIQHGGPYTTAVPSERSPGDREGASEASLSGMKSGGDILSEIFTSADIELRAPDDTGNHNQESAVRDATVIHTYADPPLSGKSQVEGRSVHPLLRSHSCDEHTCRYAHSAG